MHHSNNLDTPQPARAKLRLLLTACLIQLGILTTGCNRSDDPLRPDTTTQSQSTLNAAEDETRVESEGAKAQLRSEVEIASEIEPIQLVRLDAQHLPNAIRVHSKVISGGLPEGAEAFAELQRLGIKTVISVDGAKPDAALATQFGMRYIHLPHGYNGVPEDRSQELAKAVLELPGPIYIHCHHGKHRSPAAAAVACVGAGFIRGAEARSILEFAGTNPNYLGLFQSAEAAQLADQQKLAGLAVEFREAVEIPPLVESMVELDELFEEVAEAKKAGWQASPELPSEKILHDILLLREHFTEMLRAPSAPTGSEDFVKDPSYQALLVESETTARELESLLNLTAQRADTADVAAIPKMDQLFLRIEQSCKACHQQFRDKPLSRISH